MPDAVTVINDERPALGTPTAIAADSSRAIDASAWVPPDEVHEHTTGSIVAAVQASGIPHDDVRAVLASAQGAGPNIPFEQRQQIDRASRDSAASELGELWGDKFDTNMGLIDRYLASGLPAGVGDRLRESRLADGRRFVMDPASLQRLLPLAKAHGSVAATGDVGRDIASIEQYMRTNRAAYTRNEPLQARYRELLAQRGG